MTDFQVWRLRHTGTQRARQRGFDANPASVRRVYDECSFRVRFPDPPAVEPVCRAVTSFSGLSLPIAETRCRRRGITCSITSCNQGSARARRPLLSQFCNETPGSPSLEADKGHRPTQFGHPGHGHSGAVTRLAARSTPMEQRMSNARTERRSGQPITMYIPVFKDKLARLERRGLGRSDEARKLRATIDYVEAYACPSRDAQDDHAILVAAE